MERLVLAVEVVSPTSRQADRVRKSALLARSKVPCFWRVELDRERRLAVHEYWLHSERGEYIPAPLHPVHRGRMVTELPFPVELDLDALIGQKRQQSCT